MKKIIEIHCNWVFTYTNGEEFDKYVVGLKGVKNITESKGYEKTEYVNDDDIYFVYQVPYFCIVEYENGISQKVFNVNKVIYQE